MNVANTALVWDGRRLRGEVIGLAWSLDQVNGRQFAVADNFDVLLVPTDRLAAVLAAHSDSHFAVSDVAGFLDMTCEDSESVWAIINNDRLYDANLLAALVNQAAPGVRLRPSPVSAERWWESAENVRETTSKLLVHANRVLERVPVPRETVEQFGPLGIKLEVRSAAATRVGQGVRVLPDRLVTLLERLEGRERLARKTVTEHPSVKVLLSKPETATFLQGHRGNNSKAFDAFARDVLSRLKSVDELPVPAPVETVDATDWEPLAPPSSGSDRLV